MIYLPELHAFLTEKGFAHEHNAAWVEESGCGESGPRLDHYPAHDLYYSIAARRVYVIMVDEEGNVYTEIDPVQAWIDGPQQTAV